MRPGGTTVVSVEQRAGAALNDRLESSAGDDERIRRLGANIRRLRKERGLTLTAVADRSSLSHPFLSQIERGLAQPSMSSLHQIAEALGTSAPRLLAGSENTREATVVRAADTAAVPASEMSDSDEVRRVVVPEASPYQVVEFVGAPDEYRDYWVHDGFETIYVISGVVEVDLDGELFRLEPSDAISYDTRRPHRLRAAGEEQVRLLMIESPTGFTDVRLR